ncbi:MAG: hypothetical protein MH472_11665 [Bacteroidia bacterium]|nr:hypothetical protein [Bacteroidia bacterium]
MKIVKFITILLLVSIVFGACKKEETGLKDGDLKVIVVPTVPDVNVIDGIFVKIYDSSSKAKLHEKELWAKKGEITFTNIPKQSLLVEARMEYKINNNRYIAEDEYTFTYDGSAKTITLNPQ